MKLSLDRLGKSDETLEGFEGGRRRSLCGDDGRDRGHQTTSTGSVALFKAFDDGDMSAFLSAWAAFIPKTLRRGTPSSLAREVRVVEFLACVHCAVLPFRATALAKAAGPREASVACAKVMVFLTCKRHHKEPLVRCHRGPRMFSLFCFNAATYCSMFGLDSQSMSSFRRYLDRAQDVPRVPDLSGYYALPHVPDPSVHPSFEALFEETWAASLKTKIENLMDAVNLWRRSDPLLVRLLLRPVEGATHAADNERGPRFPSCDDFSTTGSTFSDAPGVPKSRTLNDSGNGGCPPRMAGESKLAPSHSNAVVGRPSYDRPYEVVGQKHQSERESSKNKIGSGVGCGQVSGGSVRGSPEAPGGVQQQRQRQPLLRSDSDRAILGRVDYGAVKRDLRRLAEEVSEGKVDLRRNPGVSSAGSVNKDAATAAINAALVLQTVRWRFSRAPPGKSRRGVLYHIIRNDIFDLRSTEVGVKDSAKRVSLGPKEENLRWEEFGGDPGRLVADYTVRLLSALVSMSKARSYMLGEVRNEELSYSDLSRGHLSPCAISALLVVFQRAARPREELEIPLPWPRVPAGVGRWYGKRTSQMWPHAVDEKLRGCGPLCEETIETLVELLSGEKYQKTSLAKRLLGVLERLSRRRSAQEAIASSSFVDWAAKMLESCSFQGAGTRHPCPLFVLRVTDILGNVSGRVSGRTAALAASPDLLRSFGNLLEHDDAQVRASAVRGLKLLLGAREARERALEMGMDALLQNLGSCEGSDNSDSAFEHNIQVKREQVIDTVGGGGILWAVNGIHAEVTGGGQEDAGDSDFLSDEESGEAPVVSHYVQVTNAPCGEKLLRERYRLSTAEAKEEAIACSSGGATWGGEEEELVCGGIRTKPPAW
ncbi:unnamed protein product [Ectocarpus sp. CCAP 1310/34]|nr:unnamed protein product [Ectocarpus sp. CCAP 1310/34]